MSQQTPLYLNQPLSHNIIETILLVLCLLFLIYVIKLAFFDDQP